MMMTPTRASIDDAPARSTFEPLDIVSRSVPMMGGRVAVHVSPASDSDADDAAAEADGVLRRVAAWAARLTRFTTTSELSRLNRDPRTEVPVGPTLAAVLDWSRYAEGLTGGIVDIGLLDARLSAEGAPHGAVADEADEAAGHRASPASRSWSLDRHARGATIRRPVGLRFDLDGIGKGWLADRSLGRLGRHPAAVVDADGDVAIRLGSGVTWEFGVADPRLNEHDLAILRLTRRGRRDKRLDGHFGLATSGTSVHCWTNDGTVTHHLIDPRTGRSAETDVVQATVLAGTAREAEALAKAVVILGLVAGYDLLDRSGIDGALLLTDRDKLVIHPATLRWLA
jgi:thiamine biosynthesis lipoprotein